MCTKIVTEEEDRVEKFIEGLLDNIQGNVVTAEPTRLQDAIQISNNLMDQKLKGYAENKRRFNSNQRDNRVQQPPAKRQDVGRAYTVGSNEKKGYAGPLPYCNMCRLYHNFYKRTIGIDSAYAMTWKEFMKLMTKVYCPRNEIQKIETELWNLAVRGVEKFIGGLLDNIQGNVVAAEPTRLQDAIRISNNLMDQKLKGYAENKRRFNSNQRDNCVQQPPAKRQDVGRAYTVGSNEKKGYAGPFPYCNMCRLYHVEQCIVKCGNCKKVKHMASDCKAAVTTIAQRAPVANQEAITYYECCKKGHYRRNCPKLKNQNRENKNGTNEVRGKAYALGGGEANPDSNVVTGTFLLNNRYAYVLFDSGTD
nr:hypothetical protein [Tanacetum cinerariifolium]